MIEDLIVPREFIDDSIRNLVKPRQKFSQYTKKERQKRRLEVFRLHMEMGFSAVKIADLMRVNRNTINQDIKWCYDQIRAQFSRTPEEYLDRQLFRYETQRERLISGLSSAANLQEKLAIEKLILDLDTKIAMIMLKVTDYQKEAHLNAMKDINEYLDKHHKKDDFPRFVIKQEFDEVTTETRKKIDDLIINGKKWHSCKVKKTA